MAYDPEGMSVLSYANGCTVWHYRSSDAVNSVPFTDNNYFLPASDLLKDGDIILAQDNTGRTVQRSVREVSARNVKLSPLG